MAFVTLTLNEFKEWADDLFTEDNGFKDWSFKLPMNGIESVVCAPFIDKPTFECHIYTTLDPNEKTRAKGEDAIRIILYDLKAGKAVKQYTKVLRTGSSDDVFARITDRVIDMLEEIGSFTFCKKCGSHMVQRKNGQTQQMFMACSAYPNCCKPVGYALRNIGGEPEPKPVSAMTMVQHVDVIPPGGKVAVFEDMTPLVEMEDCYPSTCYAHFKYGFEKFNRLQSTILQHGYWNQDCNLVLGTSTSTGKTISGELFVWETLKVHKKKVCYVSPLKSLTLEKFNDWNKSFGNEYKICILTGDFVLTDERAKELNEADLICLTSEMVDSRTRNHQSERSDWIFKVGLVITDESHIISTERGHAVEVGLMRFCKLVPSARVLMLSATMPNVSEFKTWLTNLNGKPTEIINNNWRPTTLQWNFIPYMTYGASYSEQQEHKQQLALNCLDQHPEEKALVFVHDKNTGRSLETMFRREGIDCKFHNADLEMKDRVEVENSFESQEEDSLRVLISTSTLAWGRNLPAVNVVIVGHTRGIKNVDELDIIQMAGRCVSEISNILMSDGTYKQAIEINEGDTILAVDSNNRITKQKVLLKHLSKNKARRIMFSSGTEIDVSNHPLLTWEDGYISSDKVKVGDKISIISSYELENEFLTLYDLFITMLDFFKGRVKLSKNSLNQLKDIKEISDSNGLKYPQYKIKKLKTVTVKNAKHFGFDISVLCSKNGSEFNLDLLKNNLNILWLLGLISADGSLSFRSDHSTIRISQVDLTILNKIREILNSLNLSWYESEKITPFNSNVTTIEFSSYVFLSFLNELGFVNTKIQGRNIEWILHFSKTDKANFIQGLIDGDGYIGDGSVTRISSPNKEFLKQLKKILLSLSIRSGIKLDTNLNTFTLHFGKEGLIKLLSLSTIGYKSENLNLQIIKDTRPLKGDLFYTRVEKIEELDEINLVNFSIDKDNTFIVEDIVTHNCGRLGWSDIGRCYLICDNPGQWDFKVHHPRNIISTLLNADILGFHVLAEISNNEIWNKETLKEWFSRSLAFIQVRLDDSFIDTVLNELVKLKMLVIDEHGVFKITTLGKISASLYFYPRDVHHWAMEFSKLEDNDLWKSDLAVSYALGTTPSWQLDYVPRNDQNRVAEYTMSVMDTVPVMRGNTKVQSVIAADLYDLITEQQGSHMHARQIKTDIDRIMGAISWIDSLRGWDRTKTLNILALRIKHGVRSGLAEFCALGGIGVVRARKLEASGIKNLKDLILNPEKVTMELGKTLAPKVIAQAKQILRSQLGER